MAETVRKRMTRQYTHANGEAAHQPRAKLAPPPLRALLREGLFPALFVCLCSLWVLPGGIAPAATAALAALLLAAPSLFAYPSLAALFAAVGGLLGCTVGGALPQGIACILLYAVWAALRRFSISLETHPTALLAAGITLVCMLAPGSMIGAIYATMTAASTAILVPVMLCALSVRPGARTMLSVEELICIAVSAIAAICGTQAFSVAGFSPALLGGCVLALSCGSLGGAAAGAAVGVLVGGFLALGGAGGQGIAVTLGLAGLLAGAFRKLGRLGSVAAFSLGCVIASAAGGMLLAPALFLHALPACAALLCVPGRAYNRLLTRFDRAKHAAMVRSTVDSGLCERVAQRLGACSSLFLSLAQAMDGTDARTEAAARQMHAAASTLQGLEQELSSAQTLDIEATQSLREALDRGGYAPADADVISTHAGKEVRVRFSACNGRGNCIKAIGEAIVQGTGIRMRARTGCAPTEGACALVFEQMPPFDVITGFACAPAKAPCGDSHLLRALGAGRLMMAIADGMGSGEAAAGESDRALTLLEGCLCAGIDPMTALPMVNDILLLKECGDMYTTLDLCVLDLHAGLADFYKIGSPNSYIKRKGEVMTILSGALPMGILGGVTPAHNRVRLREGDVIVMASDGISDASREEGWMRDQLRRLDTRNPQTAADILEAAARFEAGEAADDRTALCARVFFRG